MIPAATVVYAALVLIGIGAAGGWSAQSARVRAAQAETTAVATERDAARAALAQLQQSAQRMVTALDRQNAAVAACAAASAERAKRGDAAISESRRYVDTIRPQIDALSAQIRANAGLTCEQALAEMRAELLR